MNATASRNTGREKLFTAKDAKDAKESRTIDLEQLA